MIHAVLPSPIIPNLDSSLSSSTSLSKIFNEAINELKKGFSTKIFEIIHCPEITSEMILEIMIEAKLIELKTLDSKIFLELCSLLESDKRLKIKAYHYFTLFQQLKKRTTKLVEVCQKGPLTLRKRCASLVSEVNPIYLWKNISYFNIESSEERLKIFMESCENSKNQGILFNWFDIYNLVALFKLDENHQLTAIKYLLSLNSTLIYMNWPFIQDWHFKDAASTAKLALILKSYDIICYKFILEKNITNADVLHKPERTELEAIIKDFNRIQKMQQDILNTQDESEFLKIMQNIQDEEKRFKLMKIIISPKFSNSIALIEKAILYFDKINLTLPKLRLELVEILVGIASSRPPDVNNKLFDLICSHIEDFKLDPASQLYVLKEIAKNSPSLIIHKLPFLVSQEKEIENYELVIFLIRFQMKLFIKNVDFNVFKFISPQKRAAIIHECMDNINSKPLLDCLSKLIDNIDTAKLLTSEDRFVLYEELNFKRAVLLIKENRDNIIDYISFVNSSSTQNKLKFIKIFFFKEEFVRQLCKNINLIDLNQNQRDEIIDELIYNYPLSCAEFFQNLHLTPEQCFGVSMLALIGDPGKLLDFFEKSDFKIKGSKHQILMLINLLQCYENSLVLSGSYQMVYLKFIPYLKDLPEEEILLSLERIWKLDDRDSIHSFITAVLDHHNFFISKTLGINLIRFFKNHSLVHTSLLFKSVMFNLIRHYKNKDDLKSFFSEIYPLLADEEIINGIKACTRIPWEFHFQNIPFKESNSYKTLLLHFLNVFPSEFAIKFKNFNISDEALRIELVFELIKKHPVYVTQFFKNFEISDVQSLNKLGYSIYKQNCLPIAHLKQFKINSIEELNRQEILQLKDLSKEDLEKALQKNYWELEQPELLELIGRELYKKKRDFTQDYEVHWAARFIGKAAAKLQEKNQLEEAISLRIDLAQMSLISQTNPLNALEKNVQIASLISYNGALNFGAPFQFMGSNHLKGGGFHVRDVLIDHKPQREMTFKLAYWAADQVRENLKILEKEPLSQKLMEANLCSQVKVSYEPFIYYPLIKGIFETKSDIGFKAGLALTVNLCGLAKIQIGDSPSWGSMFNYVRIGLDPKASSQDIQKTVAIMGLAEIVTEATAADIERIVTNTLIRFHAPQFAAIFDTNPGYHEKPISELFMGLPSEQVKKKVKKSLKQYKIYKAYGYQCFSLPHLIDKAEYLKGRGFVANCKGDVLDIAARMGNIFKIGMLSTQKRFELGLTHVHGDSPQRDLKNNSADGIFFRLLSESSLSEEIVNGNVKGNIQIYAKLKAIELLPYFYHTDQYGTRLRNEKYKNRPDFKTFFSQQDQYLDVNNEVIFKNWLDPRYLCAITYQDPRKVLVEAIEKLGHTHLFTSVSTPQEKADQLSRLYFSNISEDRQKVLKALEGPDFNAEKEMYRFEIKTNSWKKLETHWMIDPKIAIQLSLRNAGVDDSKILIVESECFTPEILHACHQPLQEKVRQLALKPHLSTQLESRIRDDAANLIDSMRIHLKSLSNSQLLSYTTDEEILKSINTLKRKCQKYLSNIAFSGQDSLNRELLTQDFNYALHNPKVIICLYVLEELQERESEKEKDTIISLVDSLIFLAETKPGLKKIERKITDCLYLGLKDHHPVLLERLPNNQSKGKVLAYTPKHQNAKYLREYVRRAKLNNFKPIITAIEEANKILFKREISPCVLSLNLFNSAYDPEKWKKEYGEAFLKILSIIQSKDERELLSLIAQQFLPHELKKQVKEGFRILMEYEKKTSSEMVLDDIVKYITESDYLLDQKISHLFCDRLHLLAALKSDSSYSIPTQLGPISLLDLMKAIIKSFEKGVNQKNAIAAEQFYLRITQILNRLINE